MYIAQLALSGENEGENLSRVMKVVGPSCVEQDTCDEAKNEQLLGGHLSRNLNLSYQILP